MQRFADLYRELDATTSRRAKIEAMARYFEAAPPADAAWALFFLCGRRLKRLLPPSRLRPWATAAGGVEPWLFEECYAVVGDLAETVSLLVPAPDAEGSGRTLAEWVERRLEPLADAEEEERRAAVVAWWRSLPAEQVFLLNKMLTGGLRVGVSRGLAVRAVARVAGLDPTVVEHRLMGPWRPSAAFFTALLAPEDEDESHSRPYPFHLASPLAVDAEELGPRDDWLVEWKWDGIRGQLVRRAGEVHLWSRGEELVTERFPEIETAGRSLPDGTVLDGEILAWRGERPLPFARLQRRIGRRKLGPKILAEAPAVFVAYDLLEADGEDLRAAPLSERRRRLERLLAAEGGLVRLSPAVDRGSWSELRSLRAASRERGVEGLMLKRWSSAYRAGRRKGDWWKWKVEPLRIDAVLMYAQAGHGRRANLYTDYTFGVWRGGELVPVAKAYSGLSDAEIRELDRWIRRHVRERFGPVRAVEPVQVFELACEGIQPSTRHKSGVAVRFPRIARWRRDQPAAEADSLEDVKALLPPGPKP